MDSVLFSGVELPWWGYLTSRAGVWPTTSAVAARSRWQGDRI